MGSFGLTVWKNRNFPPLKLLNSPCSLTGAGQVFFEKHSPLPCLLTVNMRGTARNDYAHDKVMVVSFCKRE
jgi:hypothetical protein